MKVRLVVLACVLLLCIEATGYKLEETISAKGNGDASASTNIANAADSFRGYGSHWYHRFVQSTETNSELKSDYNFNASSGTSINGPESLVSMLGLKNKYPKLIAPFKDNYNQYGISMDSGQGKLAHIVSTNFIKNLKSNSLILNSNSMLSTNYDIEGSGVFSEAIIDRKDDHPKLAASAWVSGKFDVNSKLSEVVNFDVEDYIKLIGKLNNVTSSIRGAGGDSKLNYYLGVPGSQGVSIPKISGKTSSSTTSTNPKISGKASG